MCCKKFPFIRAQGRKKAKRDVWESRVLPDGSRNYNGDILQCKDDMYWVDCCVKVLNDGTLSDPQYSLKQILKVLIFPQVKQLVQSGGEFENAQVVIQGDRSGTHEDSMLQNLLLLLSLGGMGMVSTVTIYATCTCF